MRRIAPLGYWVVRILYIGLSLFALMGLANSLAQLTMGGLYAGIVFWVAFVYIWILYEKGWTVYYSADPLNSDLAFPENGE